MSAFVYILCRRNWDGTDSDVLRVYDDQTRAQQDFHLLKGATHCEFFLIERPFYKPYPVKNSVQDYIVWLYSEIESIQAQLQSRDERDDFREYLRGTLDTLRFAKNQFEIDFGLKGGGK